MKVNPSGKPSTAYRTSNYNHINVNAHQISQAEYDALFATFNPNAEGKLDGEQAVEALQSTDLDQDNLFKVVRGRTRRQLPSLPPNANAPRQPNFLRMTNQRSGSWRRTAVMVC